MPLSLKKKYRNHNRSIQVSFYQEELQKSAAAWCNHRAHVRQDTRAITPHIQHSCWGPSSYLNATSQQQGLEAEHSSSACREKQLIVFTKTPVTTDNGWKQCPHPFLSSDELPKQSSEPKPFSCTSKRSPGPCHSSAFPTSFAAPAGIAL